MEPLTQTTPIRHSQALDEADLTGRTLGEFHVLRRLGQGGMGQIYLAEQISLQRKVALKILRTELASDPIALQRFKAEATAVAQATHANIVQIHAIGEADGIAYMALEYVEGRNLHEYLEKKGPPDQLLALSIMRQVAAALQRAAELGIIHRDIKPDNILLTKKGEVKVADFGLSRCLAGNGPAVNLTQSGVTMGTPLYMSPEQVEGKPLDCRTDMYSFGVTCYHMLAGRAPFDGGSPFEVALQHVRDEPKPLHEVRPDLPAPLCAVVHKMMAKDPAARYQTGRELLKDIARLRESLSGHTAALPNSVQLEPVASAEITAKAPSMNVTQVTTPLSLPVARRGGFRSVVVAASLLLAGFLGTAAAWFQHRSAFRVHDGVAAAPEVHTGNQRENKEQALLTLLESSLEAKPGQFHEVQKGFQQGMDLGIYYFEEDRLDDARKLYDRFEHKDVLTFKVLGHLGQAIALALRNEPNESNKHLKGADSYLQRGNTGKWFQNWVLTDARWRYWINKAIHYNLQNGLDRRDVPQTFRPFESR